MEIRNLRVGSYQTNCYVVWNEKEKNCIIIDPGYTGEEILEQVRCWGKTPAAILLTHGHFDHVGGVKSIAAETGCPVYICKEDLSLDPLMTDGVIHYTHTYGEGDCLDIAGLQLKVLHTPGHTPGSVCLLCEDVMFSGDTLFAGTCGRTDLKGSDPMQMQQSLKRLKELEGDCHVLPGHGLGSTLEQERRSNPYMYRL